MEAPPPPDERHRAGRFVRQLTGYRAFLPRPLPPEALDLGGALRERLSLADRALGRLDGSVATLPHPDLFVFMYVRKEAVLSSQIEGTQSSLRDVLAAEADVHSADLPRDVDEVVNCVAAMNHGLERLAELPVCVRLLREIHQKLLAGTRGAGLRPGELRSSQNWIGPAGCTLNTATFVPPPPHEVLPALGELEKFVHRESGLPLLVKIGLVHAQFETIHPFLDGNGRLGRLLITFLLVERGVLQKPVLYLSHYLKKHRETYYDRLQAVRDRGAWEPWLEFFVRGVEEVASEAAATAQRIQRLRERHREAIASATGRAAIHGHRVLDHLYRHPIVSAKQVAVVTGLQYDASNKLVAEFERLGILHEITGQKRNRRFRYDDYIALFDRTEPHGP